MNDKQTVRKLHNTGWKNSYHTSADISMLGYGCGVYMYPQFFVEDLDIYQMLPYPYLRFFYGGPGDKGLKKWVLDLENRAEKIVWECIESRIMSDDSMKKYRSILVNFERKMVMAKEILPSTCRIGEKFLLHWL